MDAVIFDIGVGANLVGLGVGVMVWGHPIFGLHGKATAAMHLLTLVFTFQLLGGGPTPMLGPFAIVQWGTAISQLMAMGTLIEYLRGPARRLMQKNE